MPRKVLVFIPRDKTWITKLFFYAGLKLSVFCAYILFLKCSVSFHLTRQRMNIVTKNISGTSHFRLCASSLNLMSRLERLQFQRCYIVRGCLRSPGMEHVLFNTEST